MATKSKSAHWQAAFRRRIREAGLKALTVWLPKEGADRLARYPEKERGEVITRALVLLEFHRDSLQVMTLPLQVGLLVSLEVRKKVRRQKTC
jgi:hypothetical protein